MMMIMSRTASSNFLLKGQGPTNVPSQPVSYEDKQLELQIQKAIELSLATGGSDAGGIPEVEANETSSSSGENRPEPEDELMAAIRLSKAEHEQSRQQQDEEDETLKRILALSLTEK